MTDFTVSIVDQAQLDGIAWARAQYNAALPKDESGNPIGALAMDADYMTFVMTTAARSYGIQKAEADLRAVLTPGG